MSEKSNEGRLLSEAEKAALVTRIQTFGLSKVAKESKVSEMSLTRACAAIPVQRGTVALIQRFLGT